MPELHQRPQTSLLLLILVAVGFAACDGGAVPSVHDTPLMPDPGLSPGTARTGSGMVADPPDRRAEIEPEEVRGHYSYGFEISALEPCDLDECWWVERIPDEIWEAMRQLGVDEYEYVFVRIRGHKSPPGRYGHLGMCQREFEIVEVLEVRLPAPGDCEDQPGDGPSVP